MITHNEQKFWVIDDFYENPDYVRSIALSSRYQENIRFYKGFRSVIDFKSENLKHKFENIIQRKIIKWDYNANGIFQYTTPSDPLVYHKDKQTHAGVLYLTPDAPLQCGTSFWTSKHENPFQWGFLDRTKFELVDSIGNVYNRLILFKANLIHSASQYFGTGLEDSRLVQLFFFDCE
jgi:hypothetical protein